MRKICLSAAILVAATLFTSQAKSQFYFEIGGGYGLPLASHDYAIEYSSTTYSQTQKSSLSYGKGLEVGAVIGKMFNDNLGAELGISYLLGTKQTVYTDNTPGYTSIGKAYPRMLRFTPTLKLTTGKGKVRPYMKAGIVIGVSPKIKGEFTQTGMTTVDGLEEETGGSAIGFAGGTGILVRLNNKLSFLAELHVVAQNWAPQKNIITKYIRDGVDQYPSLDPYFKETDYVKTITNSSGPDYSKPRQLLRVQEAFSTVGLNVGLHLTLGKK